MSDRKHFEILCPNTHEQTVSFTREEFERKRKAGELLFHCNTCGANWSLSSKDLAKFEKELSD